MRQKTILFGFAFAIAVCIVVALFSKPEFAQEKQQPIPRNELTKKISDGNPDDRIAAIRQAAEIDPGTLKPGDSIIQSLTDAVSANNADVRAEAAKAISQLGPVAIEAAPTLIEEMKTDIYTTPGEVVWNFNSEALASFGQPVVPLLLKELDTKRETKFQGICAALHLLLTELDDETATLVMKEVGKRLENERGVRRWSATYAILNAGERGEVLIPQLIMVLDDDDFRGVMMACQALAKIGPPAEEAVPKLIVLSKEGVTSVRGHSALALGSIGPVEGIDTVGRLREMLADSNATVVERAVIALGRLGPVAIEAVDDVLEKLENKRFRSRSEAAFAHWRISGKPQPALDHLIEFIAVPDYEVDAIYKLGLMGPVAEPAIPALILHYEKDDAEAQMEVCQTLGAIGVDNENVRQLLEKAGDSPDESVRSAAAEAMKKLNAN